MATINEIVGFLKLKGGEQFSRDLKGRLAGVRESFLSINNAIAGTGLVLFLKNVNDSANSLSQANRQLAATSKLTGVDLGSLTVIAKNAETTFKLSSQQANQCTIAVSKLTGKAEELGKTGEAIGRLLDLSAAQGLDAEQALMAINQAILGIDEGTDKLFQKNPSAIYEEYAKQIGTTAGKLNDQQKAQALLNAVMTDGLKVQGEYQSFLNEMPGKQALLATALQKTSAALGQMAQTGLTPLLELATDLVNWFNSLSEAGKNLAVALGAAAAAAYLFGGALAALLPMIGPAGWVLIALGAVAGLFLALEGRMRGAAKATEEFRSSLAALSLEEAEKKLAQLREELKKVEQSLADPSNRTNRILFTQWLQRKNLLQEEIEATKEFVQKKQNIKLSNVAPPTGSSAINKKELAEAKERLDKQREFEFETNRLSRGNYLAYLKTRLADFSEWSDEWIGLQKKVFDLQKTASDEAQKAEGEKAKNRLQIELDSMDDSGKQMLSYLQQRQSMLESAGKKFTDEWMQIHQEVGRLEKAAGEARKNNFEDSLKVLDSQAKFEADTNAISREQYLDYLRMRLDDFSQWSEEWISRKREIFQLETEAQRQEAEKQKAILQEQRDHAMSIAGDLRNGIAAIGLAIAESIKTGGDAFKAFWKSVLTTALEAIERYFLLAKIKSIIEAAINPFAALKNAAPLIIAAGLLQVAKARIAALAEGTVATKPTLAMIGEGRGDAFEVVAPQRKFDAFTDELLQRALARGNKFSTGAAGQEPATESVGQTVKDVVQITREKINTVVNHVFTSGATPAGESKLVQTAREKIGNFVNNVFTPMASVALAGANPLPRVELLAPAEKARPAGSRERQFSESLRASRSGRGNVVINNHFASPLNDRRTAVRLTDEVLRPEVKRELRREERKIQSSVFSEQ